jgi:hypothetical protein
MYWVSHDNYWLPWDNGTIVPAVAMGVCLSLQLIALPILVRQIRDIFSKLIPYPSEKLEGSDLCKEFLSFNPQCPWFWVTYMFVNLPFFTLFFLHFFQIGGLPLSSKEPTSLALLFDIVNHLTGFVLTYFLATTVWIILVIIWILERLQKNSNWRELPINPYSPDNVAGLGFLHVFLRWMLSFYFFSTLLLTASSISPSTFWSFDMFLALALLGIGCGLVYLGFRSINILIQKWIECEIQKINKKIATVNQWLENVIGGGVLPGNISSLTDTKVLIDILTDERQRLLEASLKSSAYNTKLLVSPGIPAALSFISVFVDINDFIQYVRLVFPF